MIAEPYITLEGSNAGKILWHVEGEKHPGIYFQEYADFEREKLKELGATCTEIRIADSRFTLMVSPAGWADTRKYDSLHMDMNYGDYGDDSESSRLLKRAGFLKAVCEKEGVEWLPEEIAKPKYATRIRLEPDEEKCPEHRGKECEHVDPDYIRGGGLHCRLCKSFGSVATGQWFPHTAENAHYDLFDGKNWYCRRDDCDHKKPERDSNTKAEPDEARHPGMDRFGDPRFPVKERTKQDHEESEPTPYTKAEIDDRINGLLDLMLVTCPLNDIDTFRAYRERYLRRFLGNPE